MKSQCKHFLFIQYNSFFDYLLKYLYSVYNFYWMMRTTIQNPMILRRKRTVTNSASDWLSSHYEHAHSLFPYFCGCVNFAVCSISHICRHIFHAYTHLRTIPAHNLFLLIKNIWKMLLPQWIFLKHIKHKNRNTHTHSVNIIHNPHILALTRKKNKI